MHLDGGSGVRSTESHTIAFERFEGGDEMAPRRGIVADRPRRHRRRVPRMETRLEHADLLGTRRRGGGAPPGDIGLVEIGGDRRGK